MTEPIRTIVYTCPYVPAEWIAAHGLCPRRLIPVPLEGGLAIPRLAGLCPYARAFANDVIVCKNIDGIVLTTMCDQMRRLFDLLIGKVDVSVFLLNVPSTWQTPTAHRLYVDELKRLGRFLVHLGGHAPQRQELGSMIAQCELVRDLRGFSRHIPPEPVSPINRYVHDLHMTGPASDSGKTPGIPIGVIGGPLMLRDRILFDIIRDCGGRIGIDGTETGNRTWCRFDSIQFGDTLEELAAAYLRIPDPSRRPNSRFYEWLQDAVKHSSVRGLVLHRYLWCDQWHAEFARIQECARLPVLRLDNEGGGELDSPRVRTRIGAFLEALR